MLYVCMYVYIYIYTHTYINNKCDNLPQPDISIVLRTSVQLLFLKIDSIM